MLTGKDVTVREGSTAHGEDDSVIPVGQSRALAAACAAGNLKYREVPGDHDAPLALPLMEEGLQWTQRCA